MPYPALQFVFNVLLLNVLIASMTNSFSKITQVRWQTACFYFGLMKLL